MGMYARAPHILAITYYACAEFGLTRATQGLVDLINERELWESFTTKYQAMMIAVTRGLIAACLLSACLSASLDREWYSWKSLHSKAYDSEDEEGTRRSVWYDNHKKIIEHNNANRSYTLAVNEFADLVSFLTDLLQESKNNNYYTAITFVHKIIV